MSKEKENIFAELIKNKQNQPTLNQPKEVNQSLVSEEDEGQLTVDVYQTPEEIVVQSTVAGVNPEDLEINITNEMISIRGKREKTEKIEDSDYFYQECFWGKFSRSIILPQEIDPEKSTATLKNGILTIKMPKLNRQKAKKLRIKID